MKTRIGPADYDLRHWQFVRNSGLPRSVFQEQDYYGRWRRPFWSRDRIVVVCVVVLGVVGMIV